MHEPHGMPDVNCIFVTVLDGAEAAADGESIEWSKMELLQDLTKRKDIVSQVRL